MYSLREALQLGNYLRKYNMEMHTVVNYEIPHRKNKTARTVQTTIAVFYSTFVAVIEDCVHILFYCFICILLIHVDCVLNVAIYM